jgi:hypothetical protein
MKKSSLQDMKTHNRKLLLQTFLQENVISRIELARKSGLSPSTVTSLVGELISEGIVAESAVHMPTPGRSRTGLSICGDSGAVAVVSIGRSGTVIYLYDMMLREKGRKTAAETLLSGNELLSAVCFCVSEFREEGLLPEGKISGFGLLYDGDVRPSDCSVIYSTGFSSEPISFKNALFTEFHVPVTEGTSESITLLNSVPVKVRENENYACVSVTEDMILAGVMIEGRPVRMRNGNFCDLMPAAEAFGEDGTGKTLLCRFAGTVNFLCTIFPISVVFVQGGENLCRGWKKAADEFLKNTLKCRYRLRFEEISGLSPDARSGLAEIVRTKALLA